MTDTRRIEDQALRAVVTEGIRRRLRDRRWYRQLEPERRPRYADLDRENTVILLELLRIRRAARTVAAPIVAREDEIERAKAEAWRGDHHQYPAGVGA